ncbi:MAG: RluA family pseudouridine synthase [Acidobacteriota bacterium]
MTRIRVSDDENATLAVRVRRALGVSHREARELIASQRVLVDGRPATDPARRPGSGAEIEIVPPRPTRAGRTVAGPGFRVVHLDRDLVAIDKDPGVVVVPTGSPDDDDVPLVARVIAALGLAGHRADALWVVHRIDRETSGLVLFARRERAYHRLRRAFRTRRPVREYLGITAGIPAEQAGELSGWLHEDPRTHRVTALSRPVEGAVDARTLYRVLARRARPPRALVRFRLVTGRRNQIRAQAAAAGWPLVGDRWYGAGDRGPGRAALHAARLEIPAAALGRRGPLVLEAPLPSDLGRLVRRWFPDQDTKP